MTTPQPWPQQHAVPVKTFLWPAEFVGQEFQLRTDHGPDSKPVNFTLKVISVRPRA